MGRQAIRVSREAPARYPARLGGPEAVEDWFAAFWCGCVDSDSARDAFREVLAMFPASGKSRLIDSAARDAFIARHGEGLLLMLIYFLDGMDLIEHGTSANFCWLTPLGIEVKARVEAGDFGGDDE